jgi:hypothetical protein
MLAGYKGAKKSLTGETLWRKMEREMTEVKTFASKFPGINCPSKLPSGSTQLCHMKKPYIIKLWAERFLLTSCWLLNLFVQFDSSCFSCLLSYFA